MVRVRKRGESIRQFILENITEHPKDITQFMSQTFGISKQAVSKHIKLLINQKTIIVSGATKSRRFSLCSLQEVTKTYQLDNQLQEDLVWRNDVYPLVNGYPDNVVDIWHYCFTEMLNNAIDHSAGKLVSIGINRTALTTQIMISDDGEGIFKKIQRELGLQDERHAILELSKGKLTTDPKRHTGEGIFFSSRMMDDFAILSGGTYFSHQDKDELDWILERKIPQNGTSAFMTLKNSASKTRKGIFNKFSSNEGYGFTKTVVPVRLIQYGVEALVSRSQAKRLLSRVEKFKTVILDFNGVNSIGQAFADEIFRVFTSKNKETKIYFVNANREIEPVIMRALLNGE